MENNGGVDVCDTFEFDSSYFYWLCTISENTAGSNNPFMLMLNFANMSYHRAFYLNWG